MCGAERIVGGVPLRIQFAVEALTQDIDLEQVFKYHIGGEISDKTGLHFLHI